MQLSNETKVGGLIAVTAVLAFAFAWIIGIQSPFTQSIQFFVTYNFAGGIEIGSPVRVSGIKVGKVENIEFFSIVDPPPQFQKLTQLGGQLSLRAQPTTVALKEPGSDLDQPEKLITPLKLKISVRKDAARGVRKDSRFYINMAGIIGERYVEITPGNFSTSQIDSGEVVAGVDPPRVDQLISQSFDLAGKIKDLIEENKGDITRSIDVLYKLSNNLNKTLAWVDRSSIFKNDFSALVGNLIAITTDVRKLSAKAHTPEGEKTLQLLYELLWRLEPIDSETIKTFLQKEGVKVQFF